MKILLSLLITTAVAAGTVVHAQRADTVVRTPLITDVYFPVGFYAGGTPLMTTTDWRNLMPASELLQRDLSWDKGSDNFLRNAEGGANLEVAIGLDLGRNKGPEARFDKQLRLGAVYLSTGYRGRTWDRSFTGPYDTLTSGLNGQTSVIDTTWNESYNADYRFSRIGLNASYILRKRTPSKWSWYVGIGGMFGTTFNASATVSHRVYTSVSRSFADYPELNGSRDIDEFEEVHVASTGWGAAYALAGIDLRLGKTNPFWSSIHLFNELRPTMMFSMVPGSTLATTAAIQSMFGLRLDLQ